MISQKHSKSQKQKNRPVLLADLLCVTSPDLPSMAMQDAQLKIDDDLKTCGDGRLGVGCMIAEGGGRAD